MHRVAVMITLGFGICTSLASVVVGPSPDGGAGFETPHATVVAAAKPSVERASHTASRLPDGRVLLVGGHDNNSSNDDSLALVEIYDPVADSFSDGPSPETARQKHTATVLQDGRVLVLGGEARLGHSQLDSSEIFDPASMTWQSGPRLDAASSGHTATLLADGRVLITGGYRYAGLSATTYSTAQIFDPSTSSITQLASMSRARSSHTASLLADGRLLVAGGYGDEETDHYYVREAEIYSVQDDTWTAAGQLGLPRRSHGAVRLASGGVLIVGGDTYENPKTAGAEILDPTGLTWSDGPSLDGDAITPHLFLLDDDTVLCVSSSWGGIELLDAAGAAWTRIGELELRDRSGHFTVTPLEDGRYLKVGGSGGVVGNEPWAEIISLDYE